MARLDHTLRNRAIRAAAASGIALVDIAIDFGLSRYRVGEIVAGRDKPPAPPVPRTVIAHPDPRVASIWHLVDLKRAGFRQGHGELLIGRGDCTVMVPRPLPVLSYVGSTAAMCVGS